jgi:hypothetical protein
VSAGTIYTDLMSAVSDSAIAYGIDAGLLKIVWVFYSNVRKLRMKTIIIRAKNVFNGPGYC